MHAEPALKFPHVESASPGHRRRQIHGQYPALKLPVVLHRRQLRIKTGAEVIHRILHQKIVRRVVRIRQRTVHWRRIRSVTRRHVRDVDRFHRVVPHLQVFRQFVTVVHPPIHEVRVCQDRSIPGWFHLFPIRERPVPRHVQLLQRPVFHLQPVAKPLHARRAIAEHRLRLISHPRPVQRRRLTPQIPPVKRLAFLSVPRHLLKKCQHRLPHILIVKAKSRRGLGRNRQAVLRRVPSLRIFRSHPLRRRIHVHLHNHLQSHFIRQP